MTAQPDSDWGALGALDATAREAAMRQRFEELLALPAEERTAQMEAMLLAEHELEDEAHSAMTLSRLRTWTTLDAAQVNELATSALTARNRLPGAAAMRIVVSVQTVIRELPSDEVGILIEAAPSVRDALPQDMLNALDALSRPEATEAPVAAPPPRPSKPFWQFWRRS